MTVQASSLAKDLKEWRAQLGWTQVRAAKWLRTEVKTYQDWEQGRHKPSSAGPIRKLMQQARPRRQA